MRTTSRPGPLTKKDIILAMVGRLYVLENELRYSPDPGVRANAFEEIIEIKGRLEEAKREFGKLL
jgi:hypothetical protein